MTDKDITNQASVTPECLSIMTPLSLVMVATWCLVTCTGVGEHRSAGMNTRCLGRERPVTSILARSITALSTQSATGGGSYGSGIRTLRAQGRKLT